ncbi:MAG: HAD-IB family phosphatase [Candidatus Nezhaarchaeales archaeon]
MGQPVLLAAFDVDGTLTAVKDSWRYYHEALGTWGQASLNAQRFFNREISYEEWAELDVALWRGLPLERLAELARGIPWRGGAHRVAELKRRGYSLYALTTGLSLLARRAVEELGFDGYLANEVEVEGGALTGGVVVRVAYGGKGEALRRLREELGAEAVVAVGDGRSDLEMFAEADVAIAVEPDAEAAYAADLVAGSLEDAVDFLLALPSCLRLTSGRRRS